MGSSGGAAGCLDAWIGLYEVGKRLDGLDLQIKCLTRLIALDKDNADQHTYPHTHLCGLVCLLYHTFLCNRLSLARLHDRVGDRQKAMEGYS